MSLSLLADAVLKGTLLLATAFLIGLALRRTSAAARHLLWSMALLGIIGLPVLSNTLEWRLSILPTADNVLHRTSFDPSSTPSLDLPRIPERTPAAAEIGLAGGMPSSETARPPLGAMNPFTETANAGGVGSASGRFQWPSWRSLMPLAGTVWLVGVVFALARLALGAVGVWWLARRGTPLTAPRWVNALTQATMQLGIYRPVRLVVSTRAPMPFTTGYFAPLIVLPTVAHSWDRERRQAVLLHELAHLRRGDFISHVVAQVACAIYWFHPLVWAAARRMRAEGERACDELVLEAGTRPSDYAQHLLDIVRTAGRSWAPAVALPMAQRSEFEGRLLAILEPPVKRRRLTKLMGMAIVSSLAVTAIPLAALGPAHPTSATADPHSGVDPAATTEEPMQADLITSGTVVGGGRTGDIDVHRSSVADPSTTDPAIDLEVADVALPPTGTVNRASQSPVAPQPTSRYTLALLVALEDTDVGVRAAAVNALGNLQDTAAVVALMRALQNDASAEVRRAAAWALGEMGDARAVPALGLALTRDADVEVRAASAQALGQLEDAGGVDALASAMGDPSLEVRRAAIQALGQIEDRRAVPALSRAVRDTSADVRRSAIHALGQIQDPAAVAAIQPAIQDRDDEVRKTAVWALGQLEDARAVEPLSAALTSDANAEVRREAAWALGQIESKAAVPALRAAMRDENAEVRRRVVWALGQIEDVSALDALLPAIRDQDVEVRRQTAWALGQIADRRAVEPLFALLSDQDAQVRRQAAWALGQVGDPSSQTGLSMALQDQDVDVRRQAAWAMGQLDLTTAPPALLAALEDKDAEVRVSAVQAIGQIEDATAVPALSRLLDGGEPETRRAVMQALSQIHAPQSYELLVKALQDDDPEIRRLAAQALGQRN